MNNPFSRRSVKRAAWQQTKNPEGGPVGWLIAGALILAAVLIYLVKP